jgi:hypothetical protein
MLGSRPAGAKQHLWFSEFLAGTGHHHTIVTPLLFQRSWTRVIQLRKARQHWHVSVQLCERLWENRSTHPCLLGDFPEQLDHAVRVLPAGERRLPSSGRRILLATADAIKNLCSRYVPVVGVFVVSIVFGFWRFVESATSVFSMTGRGSIPPAGTTLSFRKVIN